MIYLSYCKNNNYTKKEYSRILHIKAHNLLKSVLHDDFNIQSFNIQKNNFGKPYLENIPLFFNLSHCDGLVLCAINNYELGIDAENIRPFRPQILKRCFTEYEYKQFEKAENKDEHFFRIWTLKESYIKAIGKGLSFPMKDIEFDITDYNNIKSSDISKQFYQKIFDNFIISVCTDKDTNFDMDIKILP